MSAAKAIQPVQPSRFANMTDGMIADLYGREHARKKTAEAEMEILKEEAIRRGKFLFDGDKFIVTRADGETTRLDTAGIRVEMGEDWCKKRSKTTPTVSLRPTPKPAAQTKAGAPKRPRTAESTKRA